MAQLTIKPMEQFFAAQPTRTHFRRGDLLQVEDKITRLIAQKQKIPRQRKTTLINEKHLEIVRQALTYFDQTPKISREALAEIISQIIQNENLALTSEQHSPAHDNYFNPEGARPRGKDFYDVAFYNTHARYLPNHDMGSSGGHHHNDDDQSSLFYVRCEPFADNLLLGNMQIDEPKHYRWRNPAIGKVFCGGKNLQESMIRHALLHAINQGAPNIMFQCGDAVNAAQGLQARVEVITPDNLPKFERRYQQALKKFAGIAVGDTTTLDRSGIYYDLVIAKSPAAYQTYKLRTYRDAARTRESSLFWTLIQSFPNPVRDKVVKNYWDARHAFRARSGKKLLTWVNSVLRAAGVPRNQLAADHAAKIKFLRALPMPGRKDSFTDERGFFHGLDRFMHKFNHTEICCQNNPYIKKIPLSPQSSLKDKFCYINLRKRSLLNTFKHKHIVPPELGKVFIDSQGNGDESFNFLCSKPPRNKYSLKGIISWYDKYLPATLKKFGLGYVRVPIINKRRQRAHVWLITSGLEEFKEKAIPVFAARDALKTDHVTLPQLEAAADKFGLAPCQLEVVNDWLTLGPFGPHIGRYDSAADQITLATPSLSVLAHEATHRLIAQGLVPAAEQASLIAAGRRLVAQSPELQKILNQKDAAGNQLYPAGPVRDREGAALFVENYYENNQTARQYLLGESVTVITRLLRYAAVVCDMLQAQFGNAAAHVRLFLRRVEGNHLATQRRENFRPTQDKISPPSHRPIGRKIKVGISHRLCAGR